MLLFKRAAWRAGLISSPFCRPPLSELDTKYYKDVEAALYGAGLLDFEVLGFDAKVPVAVNSGGQFDGDRNYISLNVRA